MALAIKANSERDLDGETISSQGGLWYLIAFPRITAVVLLEETLAMSKKLVSRSHVAPTCDAILTGHPDVVVVIVEDARSFYSKSEETIQSQHHGKGGEKRSRRTYHSSRETKNTRRVGSSVSISVSFMILGTFTVPI